MPLTCKEISIIYVNLIHALLHAVYEMQPDPKPIGVNVSLFIDFNDLCSRAWVNKGRYHDTPSLIYHLVKVLTSMWKRQK